MGGNGNMKNANFRMTMKVIPKQNRQYFFILVIWYTASAIIMRAADRFTDKVRKF